MTSYKSIIIGLGLLTLAGILHAAPLSASTATDLATMVEAVSQTTPSPAETVPRGATLYSAQHPSWPPYPGNAFNLPAWNLGDNVYLLADLDFDYDAPLFSSRSMMSADGMTPPGFDETGGGDYTNTYTSTFFIDTNLLWLEITNIASGTVHASLHQATNQVYAIWETTNLLTSWRVAMELWPTTNETSVLPFTVPTLNREPLFLRAQDWTGVDSNSDGIPDWWAWKYFANYNESATNDFDGDGVSNGDEYANSSDPNKISFTVQLGNQNFNTTNATGNFIVYAGVPSYSAALVNDTNLANAVWQPYDGSIHFNLGPTDGVYQVWFGLKGRASDSQASWLGTKVTLNRQAPRISITSPTNGVVAQPYLQLKGFAALPLEKVTYDLNGETNQIGLITGHTLDTNTFSYTTNYFQCYDLLLNEGTNAITLHATDPAGNTFATNLTVVLDYGTATNPTTKLVWPQDGLKLCGDSFTLRGWTEDAAALVAATVISTNSGTNTVAGIVSRDGNLWVQGLPLNEGTNFVTLTITNAAGFSSATNFTVVKSDMTLALTSIDGDLWLPTVNVSGIISDPNAAIWVNDVQGTNNGDGTWRVDNVPVSSGGVASFDVSTIPPGEPDPAVSTNVVKEDKMILQSAKWDNGDYLRTGWDLHEANRHRVKGSFEWGKGGIINEVMEVFDTNQQVFSAYFVESVLSANGTAIVSFHYTDTEETDYVNTNGSPYTIASEIGAMSWASTGSMVQGWDKDSEVKYVFLTGGFGKAGDEVVIEATGTADEIYPVPTNVPPVQITADQIGQLDTNALVYGKIKEGASVAVTSKTGRPLYTTGPGAGGYRLKTRTHYPALTDTNLARLNLGVGEEVDLSGMPAKTIWSGPGLLATNSAVTFIAPSNAPPGGAAATVIATIKTASQAVLFKVFPPTGIDHAFIVDKHTNSFPVGNAGAKMDIYVFVAPTSVSFYRVNIMELPGPATNMTGIYTNGAPAHNEAAGAGGWHRLGWDNFFEDGAGARPPGSGPPFIPGGFDWDIPGKWQVVGTQVTNDLAHWTSSMRILNEQGDFSTSKFGQTIMRTTNNVITTTP
jgi:hypothetical protein